MTHDDKHKRNTMASFKNTSGSSFLNALQGTGRSASPREEAKSKKLEKSKTQDGFFDDEKESKASSKSRSGSLMGKLLG